MPRGPKGEKRSRIDDLKAAYYVADAVHQVSQLRRNWDSFKGTLLELLIFGSAAGLALLAGWWM
jgi:hypothetical protein